MLAETILHSNNSDKWKYEKLNEKLIRYAEPTINVNLKDKLVDAEVIAKEIKLNSFEINEVKDIISKIKDLKKLCANCNSDLILAVICFRTKRRYNKRCHIERYADWKKYNINWRIYSLISDRIGYHYQKRTYINII